MTTSPELGDKGYDDDGGEQSVFADPRIMTSLCPKSGDPGREADHHAVAPHPPNCVA
jgi:hypothetical protein